MTRFTRRPRGLRTAAGLAMAALFTGTAMTAAPAIAAPRLPSPHEGAAIEDFAAYQAQFFCRHSVEPGVKAFEKLILTAFPKTHSDDGGTSEHKDGRAWDWGVDHRNAAQRKDGQQVLHWLFATDSAGNTDAMFRRLGLMYVIWNHKIWGSWSRSWQPYSCSGITACHVDHIHFSFGWAGAEKKTSFWTHRVSQQVEPPLPSLTKLDKARTLRVTASAGQTAMWLLHKGDTYTVTATGDWHRHGHVVADGGCAKTSEGWNRTSGVAVSGDQLRSWGMQWQPTTDNGNGCNTASHRYRMVLTPSASTTFAVSPPSGMHGDTGTVHVKVVRTS